MSKKEDTWSMDSDVFDLWKEREPLVVYDNVHRREWLSPTPLIHYLHKGNDGWVVIDRTMDIAITRPHRTRTGAIKDFYKQYDRKISAYRIEKPYNKQK